MALLSSKSADHAHDLLDYEVVDQSGENIGTLHSFWADPESGKLEFIGVKTGWLFGQNHVIPVEKVEIDDASRLVRIPYASEFIKEAMTMDADATISDEEEAEIYRYYHLHGSAGHHVVAAGEETVQRAATVSGTASNLTATGATAATSRTTAAGKDTIEVPLTEEQVRVGKRTVSAGQVRLRKIVRTEIVNQPVEIRHEDVVIERVSADQVRSGANTDFKEEVIDVPLTREEVVVQKDSHVTGAVRVHKTTESEQQTVSETIRKEDVEVVRDGKTITEESLVSKK